MFHFLGKKNTMWQQITSNEVATVIKGKKDVQIIDVRELNEYEAGHIQQAKLIPLSQLGNRHQEIDRNRNAIIICQSGKRSAKACSFLVAKGYHNLYNMTGGMSAWQGELKK